NSAGPGEERKPAERRVRDVPDARARPREIPVQRQRELPVPEERVPRRPVVVADELVRRWADETPRGAGRRRKASDEVVIATEQTSRADHVIFPKHRVGQRHGSAGMRFAVQVLEDLAALVVHAAGAWRWEAFTLEKSHQPGDGGRARTSAA